jgi:hypothetical protein
MKAESWAWLAPLGVAALDWSRFFDGCPEKKLAITMIRAITASNMSPLRFERTPGGSVVLFVMDGIIEQFLAFYRIENPACFPP